MLVPLLVLVIAVGAGGAIHTLYRQADDSRGAQVATGSLRLELENVRGLTTSRKAAIDRRLARAGEGYGEGGLTHAHQGHHRIAATLLMLLGALLVFYLRSSRARLTAEALAAENERLLKASRDDAITDELTRLQTAAR